MAVDASARTHLSNLNMFSVKYFRSFVNSIELATSPFHGTTQNGVCILDKRKICVSKVLLFIWENEIYLFEYHN